MHNGFKANKKSLRFLVIGRLQNQCGDVFFFFFFFFSAIIFFCQQGYMWDIVYAGTKFPIHKVWWLREASQNRQTFIPLRENVVQSTARQNSNRSSNFGCNWPSFHSKKKRKLKMPTETGDFFGGLKYANKYIPFQCVYEFHLAVWYIGQLERKHIKQGEVNWKWITYKCNLLHIIQVNYTIQFMNHASSYQQMNKITTFNQEWLFWEVQ